MTSRRRAPTYDGRPVGAGWARVLSGVGALVLAVVGAPLLVVGVLSREVLGGELAGFVILGGLMCVVAVALAAGVLLSPSGGPTALLGVVALMVVVAAPLATLVLVVFDGEPDSPGSGPGAVAQAAGIAALSQAERGVCHWLAEPARGQGCAAGTTCEDCLAAFVDRDTDVVRFPRGVVQEWSADPGGAHHARLVREHGNWRALDVIGLPDGCVDQAVAEGRDPFGCPVVGH